MEHLDDSALLRRYVESQSDEVFTTLVTRHINLVYSVALRQTASPENAEEIAQAVFIILARKAKQLRHEKALSSWLFQATRLTAANLLRSESRRLNREQEAYMQSTLNDTGDETWAKIAPLLDSAVGSLREKDRRAILLRFYEGRNLQEVGAALGASENAAGKRVNRALDNLRLYFSRRGVSSTTAIIGEKMSTHSIQAAPAALAKTVAVVAVAKGTAGSISSLTLVKGALKIMAWTKAKTVVIAGACLLIAAGTTSIAVIEISGHSRLIQGKTESEWIKSIAYFGDDNQRKTWHSLGNQGIGMLIRALKSPTSDRDTRMRVLSVLSQFSSYDREYFPQLIGLIKAEKDSSVRALEIGCYEGLFDKMPAKDKAQLFPELVKALDGRDTSERNNALVILQYYSDRANEAIPLIQEKLQDPVPGVRVMAVRALNHIDPQNSGKTDLVAVLVECITAPPGDMPDGPNEAVGALGELHQQAAVAVPALIQALQNNGRYGRFVRANAAAALGKFGIEARRAVPALTKALEDSDNGVRRQARAALGRINSGAAPG